MPKVIFVAPFLMPATVRFAAAVAELPGIRCALITQDPAVKVPPPLAARIEVHHRVEDAFDPHQLAQAAREVGAKLGGIDRLFGALEQLQVPLAQAREMLGVEGLPSEAAHNFRDKARMKEVLRAHGLPCARHALATSRAEARAFAAEVGFPLVVKPPDGAGAKATFRVDSPTALEEALSVAGPAPAQAVLIEEFMVGDEHSFETVTIGGEPVWYSFTRYLPTPLEALHNPWIQWCVLLPREREDPRFADIREVGYRALKALGMTTGLSHMEWFRRRDGSVAISEVAARPPGAQITTLMSVAHEWDLLAAWARLMVFGEFDPPPRKWAAGAAFLRGAGRGRVKNVLGLDQAQKELGPLVVEAQLPTPGAQKSTSYEGDGYVLLRHQDTQAVFHALMRLVSLIRVEYV
ncbi:MAG TPA: ATP-grasp domain-containing protein [Thermoanaerobaculia bacterium]|nr:ATP-grasp domain-containing protein [Thermoanaerobaculia bacterium]